MARLFEIIFCLLIITLISPVLILISIIIKLDSRGSVFFFSERVGLNKTIFMMPKFRTMKSESPEKATHLIEDPQIFLTPIGGFLRNSSIDEIPQLLCILRGDLTFVGPRPALFNQSDLIALRRKSGVSNLVPGITGWAQVNGRDNLSIPDKVVLDIEYLNYQTFWLDIKIIWSKCFIFSYFREPFIF